MLGASDKESVEDVVVVEVADVEDAGVVVVEVVGGEGAADVGAVDVVGFVGAENDVEEMTSRSMIACWVAVKELWESSEGG